MILSKQASLVCQQPYNMSNPLKVKAILAAQSTARQVPLASLLSTTAVSYFSGPSGGNLCQHGLSIGRCFGASPAGADGRGSQETQAELFSGNQAAMQAYEAREQELKDRLAELEAEVAAASSDYE